MRTVDKYTNVVSSSNLKSNPRQCPANFSISLRPSVSSLKQTAESAGYKSSNPSSALGGTSEIHGDASERQRVTLCHGSTSATNWFDTANANIDEYRADPLEDEPPFYIAQRPWDGGGSSLSPGRVGFTGNAVASPFLRPHDSEIEDLRSVIDDLNFHVRFQFMISKGIGHLNLEIWPCLKSKLILALSPQPLIDRLTKSN